MNFSDQDISTLKALYEKEKAELTEALLNGAEWDAVLDKRILVTELSIALHRRYTIENNPAENQTRKET